MSRVSDMHELAEMLTELDEGNREEPVVIISERTFERMAPFMRGAFEGVEPLGRKYRYFHVPTRRGAVLFRTYGWR